MQTLWQQYFSHGSFFFHYFNITNSDLNLVFSAQKDNAVAFIFELAVCATQIKQLCFTISYSFAAFMSRQENWKSRVSLLLLRASSKAFVEQAELFAFIHLQSHRQFLTWLY